MAPRLDRDNIRISKLSAHHTSEIKRPRVAILVPIVTNRFVFNNHVSFMWSASTSQANLTAVLEPVGNVSRPKGEVSAVLILQTFRLALW